MEELETAVAVAEPAETLPAPAKKKRRKRLTPGEEIIALLEEAGEPISNEERAAFLALRNDKPMAKFLGANLSETVKFTDTMAHSVFSSRLFEHVKVHPMIMSQHFDNLTQAKKCIDFAASTLEEDDKQQDKTKKMDYEARANAVKSMILGVRERGILLDRMAKLAKELKSQVAPPPAQPKNRAPDSLSQTNVAVQVNLKGAIVADETNSRLVT